MSMKLKMNENGVPVVVNGLPVYVKDDGTEIEFDAEGAFNKIQELNRESASRRSKIAELEAAGKKYTDVDIDSIIAEREKNKTAAQKRDALEAQLIEFQKQQQEKDSKYQANLRKLLIGDKFGKSELVREKMTLPVDIAQEYFGKHFEVVEQEDGTPTVVAKMSGSPILSAKRPGEYANFDEALEILVNANPNKERILKAGKVGTGSSGGAGGIHMTPVNTKTLSAAEKATLIKEIGAEAYMKMSQQAS